MSCTGTTTNACVDHSLEMYGVYRMPTGWLVRLQRRRKRWCRVFCFSTWGGEAPALLRALAWRDGIVRNHLPEERRERAQRLVSSNRTGVAGVFCRVDKDGQPYAFTARTRVSATSTANKFFSVKRHGYEGARAMAIAERERQLEAMEGHVLVHKSEPATREAVPRPLPQGLPERKSRDDERRTSNTSGVPGVSVSATKPNHPGYWSAITRKGDWLWQRAFSIKTHGFEEARMLAIAERQRQMGQAKLPPSDWQAPKPRKIEPPTRKKSRSVRRETETKSLRPARQVAAAALVAR